MILWKTNRQKTRTDDLDRMYINTHYTQGDVQPHSHVRGADDAVSETPFTGHKAAGSPWGRSHAAWLGDGDLGRPLCTGTCGHLPPSGPPKASRTTTRHVTHGHVVYRCDRRQQWKARCEQPRNSVIVAGPTGIRRPRTEGTDPGKERGSVGQSRTGSKQRKAPAGFRRTRRRAL